VFCIECGDQLFSAAAAAAAAAARREFTAKLLDIITVFYSKRNCLSALCPYELLLQNTTNFR